VEGEAGSGRDDSRTEFVEVALYQRNHVSVAVNYGEEGGVIPDAGIGAGVAIGVIGMR